MQANNPPTPGDLWYSTRMYSQESGGVRLSGEGGGEGIGENGGLGPQDVVVGRAVSGRDGEWDDGMDIQPAPESFQNSPYEPPEPGFEPVEGYDFAYLDGEGRELPPASADEGEDRPENWPLRDLPIGQRRGRFGRPAHLDRIERENENMGLYLDPHGRPPPLVVHQQPPQRPQRPERPQQTQVTQLPPQPQQPQAPQQSQVPQQPQIPQRPQLPQRSESLPARLSHTQYPERLQHLQHLYQLSQQRGSGISGNSCAVTDAKSDDSDTTIQHPHTLGPECAEGKCSHAQPPRGQQRGSATPADILGAGAVQPVQPGYEERQYITLLHGGPPTEPVSRPAPPKKRWWRRAWAWVVGRCKRKEVKQAEVRRSFD
jgi:hypothetical protein